MTKTAKIWLIVVIVVVALLLIACLITVACLGLIGMSGEKSTAPSVETPVSPSTEAPVTEAPQPSGGVTLANFNKIQTGMKYEEVASIFGDPGELTAQSEFGGFKSEIYSWDAEKGFGSASVTFMNGEVQSKAQFGLE